MAQIPITEEMVTNILQARKIIQEDINWYIRANQSWAKSEVAVQNKKKVKLDMNLNQNVEGTGAYSFSLLMNNCHRIVGLDYNGSHKNKHTDINRWNSQLHIHLWTERCRDTWAQNINGFAKEGMDIEEAFRIFCDLYNIEFRGVFNRLPPQQGDLFNE